MGVFTDYTRYCRARDFLSKYQNRIYFLFGFGNPNWQVNSPTPLLAPADLDRYISQRDSGGLIYNLNIYNGSGSGFINVSDFDLSSYFGECPPFTVWNPNYEPIGPTSVGTTDFFTLRSNNKSPLGMLALVKANLHYVSDVTDDPSVASYTFSYGGRIWQYLNSESEAKNELCNSILLESTVRAGQIATNIVEDGELVIRQVSVLAFDESSDDLVNLAGLNNFMVPASSVNAGGTNSGSVYFKEFDITKAKSASDDGTSSNPIGLKNAHVMINDYLVSSPRQSNQQDRYGYVLGF